MIRTDLYKQLRRLRSWIALGALAALPALVAVGTKLSGGESHGGSSLFELTTASGINHAAAALLFMSPFFLVVVAATFAGDSVAADANWGTLRYLLIRPVSRTRFILSKLGTTLLLGFVGALTISVAGLISGVLAFGWGPFRLVFLGEIGPWQAVGRLGLATLYVAWSLAGVLSLGFLLSTLTRSTTGAAAGVVGLTVASQILDVLPAFDSIASILPTHYWQEWTLLFVPVGENASGMTKGIALQAVYVALFGGLALWLFQRKDVTS